MHLVEAVPLDDTDPVQNYRTIRNELFQYSKALADRPELVVVTKMDVTGADSSLARIRENLGEATLAISAVTGQGIPQLIQRITERLKADDGENPPLEPLSVPVAAIVAPAAGA